MKISRRNFIQSYVGLFSLAFIPKIPEVFKANPEKPKHIKTSSINYRTTQFHCAWTKRNLTERQEKAQIVAGKEALMCMCKKEFGHNFVTLDMELPTGSGWTKAETLVSGKYKFRYIEAYNIHDDEEICRLDILVEGRSRKYALPRKVKN